MHVSIYIYRERERARERERDLHYDSTDEQSCLRLRRRARDPAPGCRGGPGDLREERLLQDGPAAAPEVHGDVLPPLGIRGRSLMGGGGLRDFWG